MLLGPQIIHKFALFSTTTQLIILLTRSRCLPFITSQLNPFNAHPTYFFNNVIRQTNLFHYVCNCPCFSQLSVAPPSTQHSGPMLVQYVSLNDNHYLTHIKRTFRKTLRLFLITSTPTTHTCLQNPRIICSVLCVCTLMQSTDCNPQLLV